MAEYLLVVDAVAPVADGESALAAAGLARALVGSKHRVTILSLAPPEVVSALPGMARRLRTVGATVGGKALDLPLFEGRAALGQAPLYVLGVAVRNRGETCALLASAASSLAQDGLLKPESVIGWGETAAAALSAVNASTRLFVLPAGTVGAPLAADERTALGDAASLDPLVASGSLLALGSAGADAVVLPSPSALRSLEGHPALAARASDQPIVAVRFGCDEPPHDPASDPALAQTFSAESPAGKAECRRFLARRGSLAVGPRTLVVALAPLHADRGGRAALEALGRLARLDVAAVVPVAGDRDLVDRARVLSIEHPGKIALWLEEGTGADRQLLAGADAVLLTDAEDLTGRAAGLALRYGALPLAPDAAAHADFLVDFDPASETGSALLYAPVAAYEIEGAVRRALALRADAATWAGVVKGLLHSAPRWSTTVSLLDALELSPPRAATA